MAAVAGNAKQLLLQVDASVELARRNIRDLERQVSTDTSKMDRDLGRLDGATQRLGRTFGGLRGSVMGAVAALGLFRLGSMAKQSLDYAASLGEVSQQLGINTRDLQQYRFIATQVNLSQEEMDKLLQRITLTMGRAKNEGSAQAKMFQKLGFDIKNANGEVKTAGQAIPELADKLNQLKGPTEQAAVLYQLFGREGQKLIPLLQLGSQGIEQFKREAEKLGLVLDDKLITQADQASDKLAAVNAQVKASFTRAIAENADAVVGLANGFTELTGALARFWQENPELAFSIIGGLVGGRIGGIPGAGAGIVAGYLAGDRLGAAAEAGNMDLGYRSERLNAAREALRNAAPDDFSGAGRIRSGGQQTLTQAKDELSRQITLMGEAIAKARTSAVTSPGGGGDLDIDLSASTPRRTQQQAYDAFRRELAAEGININSGFRTREQQASLYRRLGPGNAAPPGTSDHESHRAVDLPENVNREALRRAAARAGVNLKPELVHNRHLHQGFEDAGTRQGGGEAELAKAREEAERQRLADLRAAHAHANDLRRLEMEWLRARQSGAETEDERHSLALQILAAERESYHAQLDQSVAIDGITAARAEQLKYAFELSHGMKVDAAHAERREQQARLRAAAADDLFRLEQEQRDHEIRMEQFSAEMADTMGERRDIELRILSKAMERERIELRAIIAANEEILARERLSDAVRQQAEAELARARQRMGQLGQIEGAQERNIMRNTQGPMESYLASLPNTAAKVNEAMEYVAANGIQSIIDGLADAASGAKSLADVFKNVAKQIIADLVRIQLQKAIVGGLSNLLGGGGSAAAIAGTARIGVGHAFAPMPGRAYGGPVYPGGAYLVGENGPEIIRPRTPGVVIPNHAAGGGGGAPISLTVNAPGATAETVMMIRRELAAAAPMIVQAAKGETMRSLSRPRMP
jgi:hypothetical protein